MEGKKGKKGDTSGCAYFGPSGSQPSQPCRADDLCCSLAFIHNCLANDALIVIFGNLLVRFVLVLLLAFIHVIYVFSFYI